MHETRLTQATRHPYVSAYSEICGIRNMKKKYAGKNIFFPITETGLSSALSGVINLYRKLEKKDGFGKKYAE